MLENSFTVTAGSRGLVLGFSLCFLVGAARTSGVIKRDITRSIALNI